MEPKQQPPYPLRMPQDMRSHYEDLAHASKRSLNAEIVAGLQELQDLRDRVESLSYALKEHAHRRDRDSQNFSFAMDAMKKMNSMLGMYLHQVSLMVPKETPEGKRMIALIGALGQSVHEHNYAKAVEAAADLVKLGVDNGLLSPDAGFEKPDQVEARLREKPGLLD